MPCSKCFHEQTKFWRWWVELTNVWTYGYSSEDVTIETMKIKTNRIYLRCECMSMCIHEYRHMYIYIHRHIIGSLVLWHRKPLGKPSFILFSDSVLIQFRFNSPIRFAFTYHLRFAWMRTLSFSLSTGRKLRSQLQLHAKQVYGQMPLNLQSRQQSWRGRVLNFVVVIVVVGVGVAVVAVAKQRRSSAV